jgi:hypothetical protein
MDLVANGPLKAAIRRTRVDALLDYFQEWKFRWAMALTKPEADRVLPAFAPPKPRLTEGLLALMAACRTTFTRPDFQAGLQRAFVKVGLVAESAGRYTGHEHSAPRGGAATGRLALRRPIRAGRCARGTRDGEEAFRMGKRVG